MIQVNASWLVVAFFAGHLSMILIAKFVMRRRKMGDEHRRG